MAATLSILLISLSLLSVCGGGSDSPAEKRQPTDHKPRFAISGKIIFQSNFDGDNEIYLISETEITKLTDNAWDDEYPVWSPDGTKIAFMSNPKGNYDIYIMNSDGSDVTQMTSFPSDERVPAWFPDGKRIAFTRQVEKFLRKELLLFQVNTDTKETKRIIPHYSKNHAIPHVSPQGSLLSCTVKRRIGWDVALYDMDKNEMRFLDEGGKSCRARFSRDGKRLAYVTSQADRKGDIWIMNLDGSQKMRMTVTDKTYDYFPSWSPDDKFIAFNSSRQHDHNGDWSLCILDVNTRKTSVLFDSPGNDVFPDWH